MKKSEAFIGRSADGISKKLSVIEHIVTFRERNFEMGKLKWLVLLLVCFPVLPDFCCVSLYAQESPVDTSVAEMVDGYLKGITFFICVLIGNRLWQSFIHSFEKAGF